MSFKFLFCIKTVALFLLFVFCSPSAVIAQKSVEQQLKKEIKKILRYEIDWNKKQTPGFTILVIEPDTSFAVNFGNEIDSEKELVSDRLYGIGGLSKVYSSIAIAFAISSGAIDTISKARDIFPELNQSSYDFTILDLLHHKAGFPRVSKGLNVGRQNDFEKVTEMEFLHTLYEHPLSNDYSFIYNHSDYALLDIWIKKESNKTLKEWYELAKTEYPLLPIWKEKESSIGLNKAGKITINIEYGVFTSSLGLYATQSDLEQLVLFLLEDNPISLFVKSGKYPTEINKNILFSNGLYRIGKGKKYTIFGHGGKSINNSASIHFVPETKTGLVILSNSENGTKQLYLPLLSMINNNWRR